MCAEMESQHLQVRARFFRAAAFVTATFLPAIWASAAELPSLGQVIDQYTKAIGGNQALTGLGAISLTGRCESSAPDESGPVEILVETPKAVFDLSHGALRLGFDGESVWRATREEGLQQRKGRQFAELATVFDPSRVRWWKEWYPALAVTESRKFGDRTLYVLETRPGDPLTERLFFDSQSGLLVRDEVPPQFVFTFRDYRGVNGVLAAFSVEETTPAGVAYTYSFESIKQIDTVNKSRFQPR